MDNRTRTRNWFSGQHDAPAGYAPAASPSSDSLDDPEYSQTGGSQHRKGVSALLRDEPHSQQPPIGHYQTQGSQNGNGQQPARFHAGHYSNGGIIDDIAGGFANLSVGKQQHQPLYQQQFQAPGPAHRDDYQHSYSAPRVPSGGNHLHHATPFSNDGVTILQRPATNSHEAAQYSQEQQHGQPSQAQSRFMQFMPLQHHSQQRSDQRLTSAHQQHQPQQQQRFTQGSYNNADLQVQTNQQPQHQQQYQQQQQHSPSYASPTSPEGQLPHSYRSDLQQQTGNSLHHYVPSTQSQPQQHLQHAGTVQPPIQRSILQRPYTSSDASSGRFTQQQQYATQQQSAVQPPPTNQQYSQHGIGPQTATNTTAGYQQQQPPGQVLSPVSPSSQHASQRSHQHIHDQHAILERQRDRIAQQQAARIQRTHDERQLTDYSKPQSYRTSHLPMAHAPPPGLSKSGVPTLSDNRTPSHASTSSVGSASNNGQQQQSLHHPTTPTRSPIPMPMQPAMLSPSPYHAPNNGNNQQRSAAATPLSPQTYLASSSPSPIIPISRPRIKVPPPPRVDPSLDDELVTFAERSKPSAATLASREQARAEIEAIVQQLFPQSKLELFGSSINTLCTDDSDLDMTLLISDASLTASEVVEQLGKLLESAGMLEVLPLPKARMPIVKFTHASTLLHCDIGLNNHIAIRNSFLIRDYLAVDARVRQLCMCVKHWAKQRKINDPYRGTLSSYAYVLLVLHFLQQVQPPVLPSLQQHNRPKQIDPQYVINGCDTWYYSDVPALLSDVNSGFGPAAAAGNKHTLGQLLVSFTRLYGHVLDFKNTVVSLRTGMYLSKSEKKDQWRESGKRDKHLFSIEDPFDIGHDLGRVVDGNALYEIRGEFMRAMRGLTEGGNFAGMSKQYTKEWRGS